VRPRFLIFRKSADDILKNVTHRKLNDTERGNISMNCASIQTSLKNVQRNDSKTRVILGTNYQTLLSNYISPLNIRLIKNNLPDSTLISIQSETITSRNSFTNLFVTYSQHLESLISIDCKNQPDTFYSELENVRFLRSQLEESVNKVNIALSNHLKSVNQLREKLSNNSTDSTPTSTKSSHIDWSLFLGARYFFTEKIGGFAELGYGFYNLNLGVTFKL